MSLPTRLWVWRDGGGHLQASIAKPLNAEALEYSLMLTRRQIEKLALAEGVDVDVWVTNLSRVVQSQRKHIARLEQEVSALRTSQQQQVIL